MAETVLSVLFKASNLLSPEINKLKSDLKSVDYSWMDSGKKSLQEVEAEMGYTGEAAKTLGEKIQTYLSSHLREIGAAATAAGVMLYKFTSDAQKTNAALGMTGITLGLTKGEMQSLALAVTDVSFPLHEVTGTFEELARNGVRGKDVLKETSLEVDRLVDALGSQANVVAGQVLPMLKAFGLSATDVGENSDVLTYLVKNTSIELDSFTSMVGRVAPRLNKMGIGLNDTAMAMIFLESKGIKGRQATTAFNNAVDEATTSGKSLFEALGMTSAEVVTFQGKLEGATGATKKYADMAETQFGVLDKIKQKWSEITLKIGTFLQPMQGVFAIMTVLGPVMLFFSTTMGIATVRTIAQTVAMVPLTAAAIAQAFAVGGLSAAWTTLGVAMSANWIGLAVIAFAAMTAAIIEVIKHVDWLEEAVTGSAAKISSSIKGMTKETQSELERLTGVVKAELEKQLAAELQVVEDKKTAAKKAHDDEITRIKSTYGEYAKESKSLIQLAQDTRDAKIRALDDEANKARTLHDEKMSQAEEEYRAGMTAAERAIQAKIDAIDAGTAAEDKALRVQADADRLAILRAKRDATEEGAIKAGLAEEVSALEADIARRDLLWSRDNAKLKLEADIAAVRDGTAPISIELAKQRDDKIAASDAVLARDLVNIGLEKTARQTEFDAEALRITTERDAAIAAQDAILLNLVGNSKDIIGTYEAETAAISTAYAARLGEAQVYVAAIKKLRDELGLPAGSDFADIMDASAAKEAANAPVKKKKRSFWDQLISAHTDPTWGLPGFAGGGEITEPTLLVGLKSKKPYAIAGEHGIESILPGSLGDMQTGNFAGNGSGVYAPVYAPAIHVGVFMGSRAEAEKLLDFIADGMRARERRGTGTARY